MCMYTLSPIPIHVSSTILLPTYLLHMQLSLYYEGDTDMVDAMGVAGPLLLSWRIMCLTEQGIHSSESYRK